MSKTFELLRHANRAELLEPATTTPASNTSGQLQQLESPAAYVRTNTESECHTALRILQKHWRVSAAFAIAVVVTVTAVTLMTKPVFEPTARIQVDPPGAEPFTMQASNSGAGSAVEYLETQAKNLQSDQLAISVIRKLHLDENPDFVDGTAPAGSEASDSTELNLTAAENQALRVLKKRMAVARDTGSQLISVSVGAHSPVLAADVTNTLAHMFIERDYKMRHDAITQSSQWLGRQLDDIRARVDESNRTLAEFEKRSGIAALDNSQNTFSMQMVELSRQLMQAQADRAQLQAYVDQFGGKSTDSLPQISANPVVQQLSQKLAEVRAELSQSLAIYGKNHPNARKLQNQADELQAQLNQQRAAIVQDLKTSYSAAQRREGIMKAQMKDTSKELALMAQYEALKKEADANMQLYNALYARVKEAAIVSESKSSNMRVVDQARVLDRPTRPNKMMNISLALLLGIVGGVILPFVREAFDTKIRTPEDLMRCIGAGSISTVPVIGASEGISLTAQRVGLLGGRRRSQRECSSMFLRDRPNSPEAEALRGVHTSVRLSSWGSPPQTLLVVSAFPGEGKTTMACNLAIALSQHGRTCLVDCDLRQEGVAPAFGLVASSGLSQVLSGTAELESVMVTATDIANLTIVPAGSACADPSALVTSEAMNNALRSLRQSFEFVVVDSPPLLPFADGRALSTLVDGVVLVGRAGVTTREGISRAMAMLADVHSAPILNVVLNAAEYSSVDYRRYRYRTRSDS